MELGGKITNRNKNQSSKSFFSRFRACFGRTPCKALPQHQLWALLFSKCYGTECLPAAQIGAIEKTCRNLVWFYLSGLWNLDEKNGKLISSPFLCTNVLSIYFFILIVLYILNRFWRIIDLGMIRKRFDLSLPMVPNFESMSLLHSLQSGVAKILMSLHLDTSFVS